MKHSKSVLQNPKLINLIGLDAHIMLYLVKHWSRKTKRFYGHPYCKVYYSIWKQKFPLWGFERYIETKKYLIKNKIIHRNKAPYGNNHYKICYNKLKELIQEI